MILKQDPESGTELVGSNTPSPAAGTVYDGPVVVTEMDFGGRSIRLVRPTEPDRLLDDPDVRDWNRRDDYMPYWAYLWPAAYLLAKAVIQEPWPEHTADQPIHALEIGCGLGLAGLAALARGLRVEFSDYDPAPFQYVTRSATENGFDRTTYKTRLLDWRDLPDEQFSVILGADVIYEARLVPLVADVLGKMLAPGGVGLIGSPYRVAAQGFPTAIAERGMICRAEPATAQTEEGPIRGTIYRVTRESP